MKTPKRVNTTIVRSEMSSWLESYPWDLFSTYTFSEHFTFKSAHRAIERHYKRMRKQFSVDYPFFYVIEPHSHYAVSGTHIHGLIGPPVGEITNSATKMFQDWRDHKGHGAVDFEKYIEEHGAEHYLTKYLVKSEFDSSYWDIFNINQSLLDSEGKLL